MVHSVFERLALRFHSRSPVRGCASRRRAGRPPGKSRGLFHPRGNIKVSWEEQASGLLSAGVPPAAARRSRILRSLVCRQKMRALIALGPPDPPRILTISTSTTSVAQWNRCTARCESPIRQKPPRPSYLRKSPSPATTKAIMSWRASGVVSRCSIAIPTPAGIC